MTLLFMDGFDAQDTFRKWTNNLSGPPVFQTGRYGHGSAFRAVGSGRPVKGFTPSAQVIVGFAFMIWNYGSARALAVLGSDSGSTGHVHLEASSGGALQASRGGSTVIGSTAAGTISQGVWYYVEHRLIVHDTTGVSEVRLNGVQVFSFTGDTKNVGTSTNIDSLALGNAMSGNLDGSIWFDDLYVLNTLGSVNNTFLGETVVRTLMPTGAGASTALTPTGTANNWENVDDVGIGVADYNTGTSSGQRDTYALANLPVTPTTIHGVQTVVTGAKTDPTATSLKPVIRSGGTNYYDSTLALSIDPITISTTRETDPATSAAWTKAGVDAAEVGAEVA